MRISSRPLFAAAFLACAVSAGHAAPLREPTLHIATQADTAAPPRVAVTLDACGGRTDQRILSALVENRIPATIFVTGLWLKRNPEALAIMQAHPDLFELENHGGRHIPAVDTPRKIYGISAAGTPEAQAHISTLAVAHTVPADMRTLIIVGAQGTRLIDRPGATPWVYTPRSERGPQ